MDIFVHRTIDNQIVMDKIKKEIEIKESDNILDSYSAENEEHPDWFIYEYESHRKVLVQIDSITGKVFFLREL